MRSDSIDLVCADCPYKAPTVAKIIRHIKSHHFEKRKKFDESQYILECKLIEKFPTKEQNVKKNNNVKNGNQRKIVTKLTNISAAAVNFNSKSKNKVAVNKINGVIKVETNDDGSNDVEELKSKIEANMKKIVSNVEIVPKEKSFDDKPPLDQSTTFEKIPLVKTEIKTEPTKYDEFENDEDFAWPEDPEVTAIFQKPLPVVPNLYTAINSLPGSSTKTSDKKPSIIKSFKDQVLKCFYCRKILKGINVLLRHRDVMHKTQELKSSNENIFPCAILSCGYKFNTKILRAEHEKDHFMEIRGGYKCPVKSCKEAFPTKTQQNKHYREMHKNKNNYKYATEGGIYRCNYPNCSVVFKKKGGKEYTNHVRKMHRVERMIPCTKCEEKFKSRAQRKIHMNIHTNKAPIFQCEYCNLLSTKEELINIHKNIQHFNKLAYQCDEFECDFETMKKAELNNHKLTQHEIIIKNVCSTTEEVFIKMENSYIEKDDDFDNLNEDESREMTDFEDEEGEVEQNLNEEEGKNILFIC